MTGKLRAIVREPGDSFVHALSHHPDRESIDPELARRQHSEFRRLLESLGVSLTELAPSEEFPDACFTADVAVVVDGRALVTRTGALSRRGEANSVEGLLTNAEHMESPATLEGGDVLNFGGSLVVGLSERTNAAGVERLTKFAGIPVATADVPEGVLHLGTASSALGPNALIGIKDIVESDAFADMERLIVPEAEAVAANVIVLGKQVIAAKGHRGTRRLLEDRSFTVNEVDLSEFAKADGGPSCLALFF